MARSLWLILPLLAVLTLRAVAQDPWTWQNPLPEGNPLSDITFLDSLHGWAVGRAGTVLRTVDGGAHWLPGHTPGGEFLSRVSFISSNVGWVLCYEPYKLLKTIDGGLTWDSVSTLKGSPFADLVFLSDSVGFACGADIGAVIRRTADGGRTWTTVDSLSIGAFMSLHFSSPLVGWATGYWGGGYGVTQKTTNGGLSWTTAKEWGIFLYPRAVHALDKNHAFVVGVATFMDTSFGLCSRTTDGGKSWQSYSLPTTLVDVSFASPDTGWVLDANSRMYKTSNGGARWDTLEAEAGRFSFIGPQQAWAVRWSGMILSTRDGWQTSKAQMQSVTSEWLNAVSAWDSVNVVACGTGSAIVGTTDGGRHWVPHFGLQGNPGLNDIVFTRRGELWAVGQIGSILHSTDGGGTWSATQLDSIWLAGVSFVSPDTGFIAAANGRLYGTTDGGSHWLSRVLIQNGYLDAIRFSRSGMGWITSSDGVYRSTDRGQTWVKLEAAGPSLRNPAVVDDHVWFSLGNKVVFSSDGGATWQTKEVFQVGNAFYDIRALAFADLRNGWAGSSTGKLYRTTDGGMSWNLESSRNASFLSGLSFADVKHGWAVGDGGTILHYDRTISAIGGPTAHDLPAQPQLLGNFPNPFNPSTTIRFALPHRLHVTLAIYNVLGQKVADLVNNEVAAGDHEVQFNAGQLASGLYFYRLQAGAFVQTRSLILIR